MRCDELVRVLFPYLDTVLVDVVFPADGAVHVVARTRDAS